MDGDPDAALAAETPSLMLYNENYSRPMGIPSDEEHASLSLTPGPFEILETDPQSYKSGLPTDKQSSRSIGGMAERDIVDNESADGSTAELLRRLESRATTTTTTTTRRRRYVAYVGMVAAGLMALVVFLSVAMVLEVPKLKASFKSRAHKLQAANEDRNKMRMKEQPIPFDREDPYRRKSMALKTVADPMREMLVDDDVNNFDKDEVVTGSRSESQTLKQLQADDEKYSNPIENERL